MEKSLLPSGTAKVHSQSSKALQFFVLFLLASCSTYLLLSALPRADRLPTFHNHRAFDHHAIRWSACEDGGPGFVCGEMDMPLDYHNPTAGSVTTAFARYEATCSPEDRLGTIYLNPGGPGGSGRQFAFRWADRLSRLVDGRYDFVGHDPRGVGLSRPSISCFDSELDFEAFLANTVLERGILAHGDYHLHTAAGRAAVRRQVAEREALWGVVKTKCQATMGHDLRFMGTASVVRDIDTLSKALDGPSAPINYYGASYGTILGMQLVNILPAKRIGRVIIDGVVNSEVWVNDPPYLWPRTMLQDTDKGYQWLLNDCAKAGPEACPLAVDSNSTADTIAAQIDRYMDDLDREPLGLPFALRPGMMDSSTVRAGIETALYVPEIWPLYAELLAEALHGNATRFFNSLVQPWADPKIKSQERLSTFAVTCSDSIPADTENPASIPTLDEQTDEILRAINTTSSRFVTNGATSGLFMNCDGHPANGHASERFTGPFNATLHTPMLILSNTADPVTPLASARRMHQLMGPSSRLVVQDSPGHCTVAAVSACTADVMRRYYLRGELPEDGKTCKLSEEFFPTRLEAQMSEKKVTAPFPTAVAPGHSLEATQQAWLMEQSRALQRGWTDWHVQRL